jgi:hypothetical protein
MKTLNYKLLAFLILAFTGLASAQDKFEKKYHDEFDVDKSVTFEISNKFGDIKIENTPNDKITIDAEVIVKARSKDKADDIMDKITVVISKTGNIVSAKTELEDISTKNISFEINYTITMPAYLNTNLENKYGNVIINELHGKNNLAVKYGSLNVNKILDDNDKPLTSVDLGYCERSRINEFNWGKIIIKYSKLEVGTGKALAISSKYSKLKLGTFSSVVAEVGYDDYEIEDISNLVMTAKYSNIEISQLTKKFKIDNKYGNVSINKIPKDFEEIDVISKYASINLGLANNASYILSAKTNYADINYNPIKITQRIKEDFGIEINGYSVDENASSIVKIFSEYGEVDLREK